MQKWPIQVFSFTLLKEKGHFKNMYGLSFTKKNAVRFIPNYMHR